MIYKRHSLFLLFIGIFLCSFSITFSICIHLDGAKSSHVETISLNDDKKEIHINLIDVLRSDYRDNIKVKQIDYTPLVKIPDEIPFSYTVPQNNKHIYISKRYISIFMLKSVILQI